MKIAVMSLTRDRLVYTRHCFAMLADNAGCEYDHFVLDQGSKDGTVEWLRDNYFDDQLLLLDENIGISRGLNMMLEEMFNPSDYDAIVKVDNDCELLTSNTLRDVAGLAVAWDALLSPKIHGLLQPPPVVSQVSDDRATVDVTPVIGGIFLAAPARLYADGYRFDEQAPVWGTDDSSLCASWRSTGRLVGYVQGYDANHYLTTAGQWADVPDYFARTLAEGKPSL